MIEFEANIFQENINNISVAVGNRFVVLVNGFVAVLLLGVETTSKHKDMYHAIVYAVKLKFLFI
jgi:hypothetical protein